MYRLFIISKPIKEIMGIKRLFVFYNDYRSNRSIDEKIFILQRSMFWREIEQPLRIL